MAQEKTLKEEKRLICSTSPNFVHSLLRNWVSRKIMEMNRSRELKETWPLIDKIINAMFFRNQNQMISKKELSEGFHIVHKFCKNGDCETSRWFQNKTYQLLQSKTLESLEILKSDRDYVVSDELGIELEQSETILSDNSAMILSRNINFLKIYIQNWDNYISAARNINTLFGSFNRHILNQICIEMLPGSPKSILNVAINFWRDKVVKNLIDRLFIDMKLLGRFLRMYNSNINSHHNDKEDSTYQSFMKLAHDVYNHFDTIAQADVSSEDGTDSPMYLNFVVDATSEFYQHYFLCVFKDYPILRTIKDNLNYHENLIDNQIFTREAFEKEMRDFVAKIIRVFSREKNLLSSIFKDPILQCSLMDISIDLFTTILCDFFQNAITLYLEKLLPITTANILSVLNSHKNFILSIGEIAEKSCKFAQIYQDCFKAFFSKMLHTNVFHSNFWELENDKILKNICDWHDLLARVNKEYFYNYDRINDSSELAFIDLINSVDFSSINKTSTTNANVKKSGFNVSRITQGKPIIYEILAYTCVNLLENIEKDFKQLYPHILLIFKYINNQEDFQDVIWRCLASFLLQSSLRSSTLELITSYKIQENFISSFLFKSILTGGQTGTRLARMYRDRNSSCTFTTDHAKWINSPSAIQYRENISSGTLSGSNFRLKPSHLPSLYMIIQPIIWPVNLPSNESIDRNIRLVDQFLGPLKSFETFYSIQFKQSRFLFWLTSRYSTCELCYHVSSNFSLNSITKNDSSYPVIPSDTNVSLASPNNSQHNRVTDRNSPNHRNRFKIVKKVILIVSLAQASLLMHFNENACHDVQHLARSLNLTEDQVMYLVTSFSEYNLLHVSNSSSPSGKRFQTSTLISINPLFTTQQKKINMLTPDHHLFMTHSVDSESQSASDSFAAANQSIAAGDNDTSTSSISSASHTSFSQIEEEMSKISSSIFVSKYSSAGSALEYSKKVQLFPMAIEAFIARRMKSLKQSSLDNLIKEAAKWKFDYFSPALQTYSQIDQSVLEPGRDQNKTITDPVEISELNDLVKKIIMKLVDQEIVARDSSDMNTFVYSS